MVETIEIPELNVTYKAVFHMKWLYRVVRDWLKLENWVDSTGDPDHDFMEILYLERRLKFKEWRFWWRLYKEINPYYRYRLNVDWMVIGVSDVEIMHEGRRIKCHDGELTIFIKPVIEVDWQDKWEKHWLLKHFHRWFRTRVFYKDLDMHKKELWRDTYRLQGMIKKYLETKTFVPEMEVFHEKFDEM